MSAPIATGEVEHDRHVVRTPLEAWRLGAVPPSVGPRRLDAAGLSAGLSRKEHPGRGRGDLVRAVRHDRGRVPRMARGSGRRGEPTGRSPVAVRRERTRRRRVRGDRHGRRLTRGRATVRYGTRWWFTTSMLL